MRFQVFHRASAAVLSILAATAVALIMTGGSAMARAAATTATSCCTVTVNGPAVTMKITTPGRSATRTFHGSLGQRIAVVITNPVTTDNGCETLALLDPSGAPVDSQVNCGNGNPVGINPVDLTVAGTYTVRLKVDTTATGSGKLWVSAPVTVGTVGVNGPAAAMDVTRVGQGVERTFSGRVGQRIAVVITNPVLSDNGCTTLTLFDPSGAPVGSPVTSDNGCETLTLLGPGGAPAGSQVNCGNGNPVGLGPVTLASTGTYTVRFEVDTTATGHGSLKVST